MISAKDTRFTYPGGEFCFALQSLHVQAGSSVAVIGPSGSGKTTLLNLLAGILVAGQGSIRLDGVEMSELSDRARREFRLRGVGLVFQDFELISHLRVGENILLPSRLSSQVTISTDLRQRAEGLAQDVGIGDKLRRFPHELSQGERQRVAVCRALLLQPKVLLCDEPTGNLDPENANRVLEILVNYARQNQAAVVVATHDHSLLPKFDRTIDFSEAMLISEPHT